MRLNLRAAWIVAGLSLMMAAMAAHAADPEPYRVKFATTGNSDMDALMPVASELQSLRKSAPVSPFGLIARAQADVERLNTVLQSFGYYQGSNIIRIDGVALDDVTLGTVLTDLPRGKEAQVGISFQLGPLYHLRRIVIDGQLPAEAGVTLDLRSGAPAVAAEVLAAGRRLQRDLREAGYAFATVDEPIAYEDPDARVLDLHFHVDAGPKVQLGEIRFEGLDRVHEALLRSRVQLQDGEPYSATRIEQARQALIALGVFATVSVRTGTTADVQGRVPVIFTVRERKRHAVGFSASYSSDLGGSGGVNWSDRNLFGNAEQLNLSATAINLGARASESPGYDIKGQFIKPDAGRREQSLQLSVGALKQSLQAYDQTAVSTGVVFSRRLSPVWSASAGAATVHERIVQEGESRDYTLLSLPMSVLFNSTGVASPLQDALHGLRASLIVTPTESLGNPNATFIVTQLSAAAFFDLTPASTMMSGRSVLALRALSARAQGAGEYGLPPDQRFYGGGSANLRGYSYQSVGPQFPDGTPIGGTAIDAGTVEFRQRFGKNYGAALFADAAQVSTALQPFAGAFRIGVGAGVRYYTPIGPIRLDVAVPVRRRSTDAAFQLYIGLGQSF